jgi:hypothetical protein
MKSKKLFFVIVLSITVWFSYAQIVTNPDKVLSTCKENANAFLKQKVDTDFGKVKDSDRAANAMAILYGYKQQVELTNNKLLKLVKEKKLSKTDDVVKLAFDEYKVSIPDLKQDFYDKTLIDIKKQEVSK